MTDTMRAAIDGRVSEEQLCTGLSWGKGFRPDALAWFARQMCATTRRHP